MSLWIKAGIRPAGVASCKIVVAQNLGISFGEKYKMTKNESAQKNTDADLLGLAELIQARNAGIKSGKNEKDANLLKPIGHLINRKLNPKCHIGYVAEYIASRIFHIALPENGSPGKKGIFMSGSLAGQSVIVKMYGVEGSDKKGIDIRRDNVPDYYLVFKCSGTGTNKKFKKHWLIKEAFLFEAKPLIGGLKKISDNGLTTIKPEEKWNKARIYPILPDYSPPYRITDVQQQALRIFEPK